MPKVKHKSKHGITVETTEGVCRFQVELVSQGKHDLVQLRVYREFVFK